MKTFDFTLSDSIKYQTGGETTEGSMLELTAPSVNNRKRVAKLKQGFMRVVNDLQNDKTVKSEDKKGEAEIKPEEILVLLQMGSIEYDEYMDIFVNLLTAGVCKIDGKEPLNTLRADSISFDDMERLMGEYLVNFILGSLGK
jgi:hypothetical protein